MFRVKRLHTFVLESFLPVFFMTFFISDFILVMQMLWRNIDMLVGKGVEMSIFLKFFWYAALSVIPMSLPLAVLLASLMTFGNFGEKLELLAMKAAGISLSKIMKPLIVLMVFICIGAFYFQDRAMPKIQVKLASLLFSFKQKSPELAIPEGAFYSDIEGYTIYVRKKDNNKHLLKDVMIYDFSNGYDNASVILAKTGKLYFTDDKKNLVLNLSHGEGFSNFETQQSITAGIPYRREYFSNKTIVIDYDDNFNIVNESNFASSHISKNTKQLSHIIDSVGTILDSLDLKTEQTYTQTQYLGRRIKPGYNSARPKYIRMYSLVKPFYPNEDSLLHSEDRQTMKQTIEKAKQRSYEIGSDIDYRQIMESNETFQYRRSSIEFYRKFTLSFACLIFFFIGAPLGAIIGKGGIGTPAVVSVILFIIYYMIDITGYKFARDGVWDPFFGGWISSAAMLPLGLFLTYKAVNDSAIMNEEIYTTFFKTYLNPKNLWRLIFRRKKYKEQNDQIWN